MANLDGMIATVIRERYSQANAAARVCQDIVLKAVSKSSFDIQNLHALTLIFPSIPAIRKAVKGSMP